MRLLSRLRVAHPDLIPAMIVNRPIEYIAQPQDVTSEVRGVRFCEAGHETIMFDVDGNAYPCHRFSPWVTQRPAPLGPVNNQTYWEPKSCNECRLVALCPTCVGFNWQESGNPALRSTHHCEAFKLEVLASAQVQAGRMLCQDSLTLGNLSAEEIRLRMRRLDTVLSLVAQGI